MPPELELSACGRRDLSTDSFETKLQEGLARDREILAQACQHQVSIRCADCGAPAFAQPCRHERVLMACSKCGVSLSLGAAVPAETRPEGSENGATGP